MTHCLYCGAEREADQCLSCGLTSAAAEVMLRRRLVWRTAWFLVGAVLFLPVCEAFPPLELDKILIFVGGLFFVVLGLGFWMVERARRRQEIEVMKRIYFGFLPVPWILTVMLFVTASSILSRRGRKRRPSSGSSPCRASRARSASSLPPGARIIPSSGCRSSATTTSASRSATASWSRCKTALWASPG